MLNEKTFPKNVLSLRMAIEYFQPYLKDMDEAYELDDFLNKIKESKTSKVWIDCLMRPVFLMMMCVRAECEGNLALHFYEVSKMLPYFSWIPFYEIRYLLFKWYP